MVHDQGGMLRNHPSILTIIQRNFASDRFTKLFNNSSALNNNNNVNSTSGISNATLVITCATNNVFVTCSVPNSSIAANSSDLPKTTSKLVFKLSAGSVGFKGGSKTTEECALALSDKLIALLKEKNVVGGVKVDLRGVNPARNIILMQIRKNGVNVSEIMDSTGFPHNGCRPPKSRRL